MILHCTSKSEAVVDTAQHYTNSSPLKKSNDGSVKSCQGYTEGAS